MNKKRISMILMIVIGISSIGIGCSSKDQVKTEAALASNVEGEEKNGVEDESLKEGIKGEINKESVIEKVSVCLRDYFKVENITKENFSIKKIEEPENLINEGNIAKNQYWVKLKVDDNEKVVSTNYIVGMHDKNKLENLLDDLNNNLYGKKSSYEILTSAPEGYIDKYNSQNLDKWIVNYQVENTNYSFEVDGQKGYITSLWRYDQTNTKEDFEKYANLMHDNVKIDIKNEQERINKIIKPFMDSIGLNYDNYEISGYEKMGYANVILSNKKNVKDKIRVNINHRINEVLSFSKEYTPTLFQEQPNIYVTVKVYNQ